MLSMKPKPSIGIAARRACWKSCRLVGGTAASAVEDAADSAAAAMEEEEAPLLQLRLSREKRDVARAAPQRKRETNIAAAAPSNQRVPRSQVRQTLLRRPTSKSMLGAPRSRAAKWWPVSVGSHTTLLCVPGVPSGQFMRANIARLPGQSRVGYSCHVQRRQLSRRMGEGPSYCFLKNCTYPDSRVCHEAGYVRLLQSRRLQVSRAGAKSVRRHRGPARLRRPRLLQLVLRFEAGSPRRPGSDSWDPTRGPVSDPRQQLHQRPAGPARSAAELRAHVAKHDDCDTSPEGCCRCDTTKGPQPVCVEA